MKQLITFIKKEFLHILRDKRTALVLIGMPIIQMLLFGFAISTEVKDARFAVYDPSPSTTSKEIIEHFNESIFFEKSDEPIEGKHFDKVFKKNNADVIIVFENHFEKKYVHEGKAKIQIVTEGLDINTSTAIGNYATQIIQKYNQEKSQGISGKVIIPEMRMLYNPQLKSAYNFVPGVMGLVLTLICAMMTAISIVREKERGTMEVLLVSPMKPIYIIISKMVPYLVISTLSMVLIIVMALTLLDIPMAGSPFVFSLLSFLFIMAMLSIGLLISTLVSNQSIALLISGVGLMMPTAFLSGMIFPVDNMPLLLQGIACIIPARWFIEGVKKVMIEGLPILYVYKELMILTITTCFIIVVSLKNFKTRLE